MLAANIPYKFSFPWGAEAATGFITSPIPPATTGAAASQELGFPPITATPIAAGGIPPNIADFNGLMNYVTLWNQWQQAGGPIYYDSAFSTSIGGYPKGARLGSTATTALTWISTADNNTSNPDAGGSNWTSIQGQPWTWAGLQTFSGAALLPNNIYLYSKDTGGTNHAMIGYGPDNFLRMFGGLAGFTITSANALNNNLSMDDAGNVVVRNTISTTLYKTSVNFWVASCGTSGYTFNDSTNTISLFNISNSGNVGVKGTVVSGAGITANAGDVVAATGNVRAGNAVSAGAGGITSTATITATGGNIQATGTGGKVRANTGATGTGDVNCCTILNDFNASLGTAGTQFLPSGLVMNWGTATVNANSTLAVNFWTAFPNTCWMAVAGLGAILGANTFAVGGAPASRFQITLANSDSVAHGMSYIALGN